MKLIFEKHRRELIAIAVLVVAALGIGSVILTKQGVSAPGWVPVIGKDTFNLDAELSTVQAVTPGQGQSVVIAGVKVGEISRVRVDHGRAVLTMKLDGQFRNRIYRNATVLLRPKTGLKDMVAQLDPGNKQAGLLPKGQRIAIGSTLPDVNVDEILAALDGDTRSYLQLLLKGASEGLQNNSGNLANTLRRVEPTARDLRRINEELAKRRENLRHVVHNLSLLTEELGNKDKDLAAFISNSNAVFETLARQDRSLRAALSELPSTLQQSNSTLAKATGLSTQLGNTVGGLRPGAAAFAQTQSDLQPFLRDTTPVIKNQLRPFARAAQPPAKDLRPATHDLAAATPDFIKATTVLNKALNTLANKPKGQEGYLFWAAWLNHLSNSIMSMQDAHGPVRRGVFLASCQTIGVLNTVAAANPQLGTLVGLLNAPSGACGK